MTPDELTRLRDRIEELEARLMSYYWAEGWLKAIHPEIWEDYREELGK